MTIPLDDLYHYLTGAFESPVCLYAFQPHGSKNIYNLKGVFDSNKTDPLLLPMAICHDQEPLNYDLYNNHSDSLIDDFSSIKLYQNFNRLMLKTCNLRLPLGFNIFLIE